LIDNRKIKNQFRHFNLSDPQLIESTALADVFRVRQANGDPAVLKIWHNPKNEQSGADYLQALNGQGAVQRMLQWAAVKTALSISWRGAGEIRQDDDSDLLDQFLTMSA